MALRHAKPGLRQWASQNATCRATAATNVKPPCSIQSSVRFQKLPEHVGATAKLPTHSTNKAKAATASHLSCKRREGDGGRHCSDVRERAVVDEGDRQYVQQHPPGDLEQRQPLEARRGAHCPCDGIDAEEALRK